MTFNEIMEYAPNNVRVFQDMILKIKSHSLVPYVGSGLSAFAGFPTWGAFLTYLENEYDLTSPANLNFLERADWISDQIGAGLFADYIDKCFNPKDGQFWLEESAKAEKRAALFLLPYLFHDLVVTTNYDCLIEHVYGQNKQYSAPYPVSYDNLSIQLLMDKMRKNDRNPFIFKIHGSVLEPEKIILGQRSYDDAYKDASDLVATLNTVFHSQSILFLGSSISIDDRPIELMRRICGNTAKHFAVIPCEKQEQRNVYQKMVNDFHITPILYEKGKHDSVRVILEVLLKETNPDYYQQLDYKLSSYTIRKADNNYFRHDCSNPVAFVGRENELGEIKSFLESEESVLWWGITGEGGSGKTRLVDQLIAELDTTWSVKRLDIQNEDEIRNSKATRSIHKPTLLVFDYVFAYYDRISELIFELANDKTAVQKTRILLIERKSEIKLIDALCESLALSSKKREVRRIQYKEEMYLSPLSKDNLKSLMNDYLSRYYSISESTSGLKNMLLKLETIDSKLLRPLYAMFIADARGNNKPVGLWGKKEFLDYILERETDPVALALYEYDNRIVRNYINKAKAYAVFVKGVSAEEFFGSIDAEAGTYLSEFCRQHGMIVKDFYKKVWLVQADTISPIQPDIIGEYFLLKYLEAQLKEGDEQEVKDFIGKAWYHPRRASGVMHKILDDFKRNAPEDDETVISNELYDMLTNIEIPDGISSISRYAFSECSFLNSVRLPDSVEDIHANAFRNCINLKIVRFPESLPRISSGAFLNCRSLKKIQLPMSLRSIGGEAFRNCCSLETVDIPDGVTSIEREAFRDCVNLKNAVIPTSVEEIGNKTFSGCESLEGITLKNNLAIKKIRQGMFQGCKNLKSAELPDSVNSIGFGAFENCSSLERIDLSHTEVEEIGMYAFKGCGNLTEIQFSHNLKVIDMEAFSQCKKLGKAVFSEPLRLIGSRAFEGCDGLTELDTGKGVEEIGRFSFAYCTSLRTVKLNGTRTIGQYAFRGCKSLETIQIPDTVAAILEGCFEHCSSLRSINIPDRIDAIHRYCFSGCGMLSHIVLPPMLQYINQSSFARSGLTEITIPPYVKKVTVAVFGGCENLKKVTIQGEETEIYDNAFPQCSIATENIIASKWQRKQILRSMEKNYYYIPMRKRSNVGKDYKPIKKRKLARPDIIG